MSYDELRVSALQWDAIQRTRLRLGGMEQAFKRLGRPVEPWLEQMIADLEKHEASCKRAVREAAEGEPWLEAVAEFVDATHGLGPGVLIVVGLLPPLPLFANPAKLWAYLGLHVKPDGKAPRKADAYNPEKVNPRTGEKGAPVFSPQLRSYALTRILDPIVKKGGPYRLVYDARQAHTAVTHPEWGTENKKAPRKHYQLDAQRYTAKRVWRDVWRAAHGRQSHDTHLAVAVPALAGASG